MNERLPGAAALGPWLGAALLWCTAAPARALEVPPLAARVNDLAGLLDASERAALESKLEAYERGSGHQLALLTLPSLEGDSLEDFSIRVVEHWKLGAKGKDDGVLVLVAKQERQMRIEVGYGLEGDIPDAIAARIVREVMQPAFRAGDFYGGIVQAFDALMRAAGGESALPESAHRGRPAIPGALKLLLWILVMLFWLAMSGGGTPGGRHRRGGGFVLGGMGGGGFGGGFGGGRRGGGGFGGGGGGFGGGGASGGW